MSGENTNQNPEQTSELNKNLGQEQVATEVAAVTEEVVETGEKTEDLEVIQEEVFQDAPTNHNENLVGENQGQGTAEVSAIEDAKKENIEEEVEKPIFSKELPITERQYYENIIDANKRAIDTLRNEAFELHAEIKKLKEELESANAEVIVDKEEA